MSLFQIFVLASAVSVTTAGPTGLLCDWKASPAVGVSASPSFAWVVPHLARRSGCGLHTATSRAAAVDETEQLQHAYQMQVVAASSSGTASEVVLHDTGRTLDARSANVQLQLTELELLPGMAYVWRVRTWTSADVAEACASEWAAGRFTTALFNGFNASAIWLGAGALGAATVTAKETTKNNISTTTTTDTHPNVVCDLTGEWKGNGNGGKGTVITIAKASSSASSGGRINYTVHAEGAWTNPMWDSGNGTLVLEHPALRVAYAVADTPLTTKPCTRIKFDNHDSWCLASVCGPGVTPGPSPGPPAPSPGSKGPRYAYFRHTEMLRGDVASAAVFVSANQDGSLQKLLSAYRLYVNGVVVAVGPGRSDMANSWSNHSIYDSVDVTLHLQAAWRANPNAASVTFALQCYHHDDASAAMLLQAQVTYAGGEKELHTIASDASWLGFDATPIYAPSGGMGGDVSQSSTDNQPAENIDASLMDAVAGWQSGSFTPGAGWAPSAPRTYTSPPQPKMTLPVSFIPRLKPVEVTMLAAGHWFVDFGTEIMAGLTMNVIGGTKGVKMNIKLSEELLCKGCTSAKCNTCNYNDTTKAVLFPMRTNNKYEETWTLGDGVSTIENHEYKLFRYGEITLETNVSSIVDGDDAAARAAIIGAMSFDLSAWVVRYPWSTASGDEGHFNSSNAMLNKVWELCKNTVKVTSLDSATDSNTREKLPYEADGFITGGTRHSTQRDSLWQRHSTLHNIRNPTWPTEWRQMMSLMVYEDYMATGSTLLASEVWDVVLLNTMAHCVNKKTNLVDFSTGCDRGENVRDITDWPRDARDGYEMTDIGNVINAYFVACMNAMATLASVTPGKASLAAGFAAQGEATAAAMNALMVDPATSLFTDTLEASTKDKVHSAWHSQIFSMWAGVVGEADTARFPKMIDFLKSKAKNVGVTGSVYAAYAYYLALYAADFDHGHFALQMLTTCDGNSFCHMLLQGATATMEAWTREEKDNLSWSHPWASAPGTAIPRGFMGITATAPAFAKFQVKPQPGDVRQRVALSLSPPPPTPLLTSKNFSHATPLHSHSHPARLQRHRSCSRHRQVRSRCRSCRAQRASLSPLHLPPTRWQRSASQRWESPPPRSLSTGKPRRASLRETTFAWVGLGALRSRE